MKPQDCFRVKKTRTQWHKSDPPANEMICKIPEAKGQFLERLEELKKYAFSVFLESSSGACRHRKNRSPGNKNLMHGFLAFRLYYSGEFYLLPLSFTSKLFASAWKACDHKYIWEYYALQYSKYDRDISFIEWLNTCPKHEGHDKLIVISHDF